MLNELPPSGPWKGYYLYGDAGLKHRMTLNLNFASDGGIEGEGSDDIAPFVITGRFDPVISAANWAKAYAGMHSVDYSGIYCQRAICGDWTIGGATGGFWIWPQSQKDVESEEQHQKEEQPQKMAEPTPAALRDLLIDGFIIIPGPVPEAELMQLTASYDDAVLHADPADIHEGSTTTRVSDFVNRGIAFDRLYVHPPLLDACCRIITQSFKLSTLHARTLRPQTPPQKLHVDFAADAAGWPMVGFIYMVDGFRPENGATLFAPRSQGAATPPSSADLVPACGPAGSLIVFNGSIWHGHGANQTGQPRRSLQGAYIRRCEKSGGNLPARMLPETLARVDGAAKYLLGL